jgi:hypothetical protein
MARQAHADFNRARRKAFFGELVSTLRKEPNWLLSFDDVQKALPMQGQRYKGLHQVSISAIVGSVDRYADFDRQFLPVQSHIRPRWESIAIANLIDVSLPPVQLYKIGQIYFVKDGNHRVSVAKQRGMDYIDAEVIEMSTSVDLSTAIDPQDMIRLGERARFLRRTGLDRLRPSVCIDFTALGRYDVLLEHISAHRWYMGLDQNRPIEWQEAVVDWYDSVYLPVVHAIWDNDILRNFPGRTEGDLYLWVMDHRWYLREETGWDIGAGPAVLSYSARYGSYRKWFTRVQHFLQNVGVGSAALGGRQTMVRSRHDLVRPGMGDCWHELSRPTQTSGRSKN